MLYKTISASPSEVDTVEGVIRGYFAHFGSKDSDGDIIQKSAFDKTIREHGPAGDNRIKHLINHDQNRPAGAIKELGPDSVGLAYVSQLLKLKSGKFMPDSEMVMAMIDSGYNVEHSIGYAIPNGKQEKTADGNLLHEIKLYEGSTLTFYGANQNTPVTGLKSADFSEDDLKKLFKALKKSLSRGNWSDEAYLLLEKHHNQVNELLKARQVALDATSQQQHNDAYQKHLDDLKDAIHKSLTL